MSTIILDDGIPTGRTILCLLPDIMEKVDALLLSAAVSWESLRDVAFNCGEGDTRLRFDTRAGSSTVWLSWAYAPSGDTGTLTCTALVAGYGTEDIVGQWAL